MDVVLLQPQQWLGGGWKCRDNVSCSHQLCGTSTGSKLMECWVHPGWCPHNSWAASSPLHAKHCFCHALLPAVPHDARSCAGVLPQGRTLSPACADKRTVTTAGLGCQSASSASVQLAQAVPYSTAGIQQQCWSALLCGMHSATWCVLWRKAATSWCRAVSLWVNDGTFHILDVMIWRAGWMSMHQCTHCRTAVKCSSRRGAPLTSRCICASMDMRICNTCAFYAPC